MVNGFLESLSRTRKIEKSASVFSFINELENVLNCHVDVVTTGIEDKQFLSIIMKEGYFYMKNEDIPVQKKRLKELCL